MGTYLAHSASEAGPTHPLKDHLESVAELAAGFAAAFGAEREARLAGLLHDLGKYGDLFQKRLEDPSRITGVDHWTMGAWAATRAYGEAGMAEAWCAAGHHLGLQTFNGDTLRELDPRNYPPGHYRLSESDLEILRGRLREDRIELPAVAEFKGDYAQPDLNRPSDLMLDYRMLYSALVDADFLDTEAHFNRAPDGVKCRRQEGPDLNPAWAAGVLLDHIRDLAAVSTSDPALNRLRADLLEACRAAATGEPGRFTLSAPTGAGKTLAMLAFALEHAAAHGLRRVVMVIPYLTIIDQTARVFREVFGPHLPSDTDVEHYILEHHSMAGLHHGQENDTDPDDPYRDADNAVERRRRELAENWDAPIIVTTSVQMLESLFARRPGACRKLHRLARSVILFDEVQTLPNHLAGATLATLGRLCDRFGSTVVFSTATQPAFTELNQQVEKLGGAAWEPREIVPAKNGLFKRVGKRVRVTWPAGDESLSLEQVAAELGTEEHRRSLCVVNLKRQATGILRELADLGADGLFHLSTSMCPAHREAVLEEVRGLLADADQPPVRLVSTQCVEAGVDLDFPVVWRAWGPLTAIAQAAGRCNRNANLEFGLVRVFRLDEGGKNPYPDDAYKQAAMTAEAILERCGPEGMDINDPDLFKVFYQRLYFLRGDNEGKGTLADAIKRRNFEETAGLYRLIDKNSINILVPYDPDKYAQLAEEARNQGLTRDWIAKARPHTVGWFRPRDGDPIYDVLEPIPLIGGRPERRGDTSPDWFICRKGGVYNEVLGFLPSDQLVFLHS